MSVTKSRTVEAYKRLRSDIVRVRYSPGEKLRIDSLCSDLGVSLGAVREALSRLSSEGLVVAQPQRGFVVAPVSLDDLRELTQVRITVESICLARSIEIGGDEWEVAVRNAWTDLSATPVFADDKDQRIGAAWSAAHERFHAALVSACDNTWWLRFRNQLFDQSERYRQLSVPLARYDRDVAAEHRGIVEATLSRNTSLAVELLEEHFAATTNILLSSDSHEPGRVTA